MSTVRTKKRQPVGEPAWDVAELFPAQGEWTEEDYRALPGNRLVELTDGFLEVLPVPTTSHHRILAFLYAALLAFLTPGQLGTVFFAGIRVRLRRDKYREPDLVCLLAEHEDRIGEEYWDGADLVMEVVSGTSKDRQRDLKTKRTDYALARIPEYWIVDPREEQITVLRLKGRKYVVHGTFGRGEQAASALLKGFAVAVDAVFAGRPA